MERTRLIQARIRKHWTQAQAATRVEVDERTYRMWERGTTNPRPTSIQLLCRAFETSAEDLGFELSMDNSLLVSGDTPQSYIDANLTTHLLSSITTACSPDEIPAVFTREMPSERLQEALRVIAMYPLTICIPLSAETAPNLYAAAIIACSYLSNGSPDDIQLASSMITAYLALLYTALVEMPRFQKTISWLLAQALQLKSRVSGLLESIERGISYAEEAIKYARKSGDRTVLLMQLRGLFADYEFGMTEHPERYRRATELIREIDILLHQSKGPTIPALVQSWAYSGLAKYQALCNEEQQMLTSLNKAEETISSQPQQEETATINHNLAQLFRHKAITYAYFGRQDQAFDVFREKLIDINDPGFASKQLMPARNRLGTLSEFTFTTLYLPNRLKDKELSVALWKKNIEETRMLRSESYYDEARIAYSIMKGIWSDDAEIKDLRGLLIHW